MKTLHDAMNLAVPPEIWTVELRDGSNIEVLAHGYSIKGSEYFFSLLFKGSPNYEVTSLKIPLALLAEEYD